MRYGGVAARGRGARERAMGCVVGCEVHLSLVPWCACACAGETDSLGINHYYVPPPHDICQLPMAIGKVGHLVC